MSQISEKLAMSGLAKAMTRTWLGACYPELVLTSEERRAALRAGYIYFTGIDAWPTREGAQAYHEARQRGQWCESTTAVWVDEARTGITVDGAETSIENPAISGKEQDSSGDKTSDEAIKRISVGRKVERLSKHKRYQKNKIIGGRIATGRWHR